MSRRLVEGRDPPHLIQLEDVIELAGGREYPRLAVYIGIAGLVVHSISAVALYFFRDRAWTLMSLLMGPRGMAAAFITMGHSNSGAFLLWVAVTFSLLSASLVSVILLTKTKLTAIKVGSVSLIVLALLSSTTTFGLVLGSALMFTSGLAGIFWVYRRTLQYT